MSRLIDADRLYEVIKNSWDTSDAEDFEKSVFVALATTPTIEERKTGKWQKLYGYVTPGGDPVWRCSECGKGIHVYGIEHGTYGADIADGQWVACPNCGVMMS